MRERRKESDGKGVAQAASFGFAHRAGDRFAFGRERFLVVRLNCSLETGDPVFQLPAIIRPERFRADGSLYVSAMLLVELRGVYLTSHLYMSLFGLVL